MYLAPKSDTQASAEEACMHPSQRKGRNMAEASGAPGTLPGLRRVHENWGLGAQRLSSHSCMFGKLGKLHASPPSHAQKEQDAENSKQCPVPSQGGMLQVSFKIRSLTSFFSESSFFLGGSWCLPWSPQLSESSLGEGGHRWT